MELALADATQPGISYVANEAFNQARTAHIRIRDFAGDVGTHVHEFAKALLAAEPLPVIEGQVEARCCKALIEWAAEHEIKPMACERKVMSLEHWYAGTCD